MTTSAPTETERKQFTMRSALREIVETILLTLVIFLMVRAVVENFKVEGSSMEPNLHSGQYLLVNKAAYFNFDTVWLNRLVPRLEVRDRKVFFLFESPQRGDVVVFRFPQDPGRNFIKRVIALPGDTVEIRAGQVYVNGEEIDEPYIVQQPSYFYGPKKVSSDHYFVLGDNRNNSSDSHVWGEVPRENIIGKAWLVYWPANAWGLAPNYPVAAGDNR